MKKYRKKPIVIEAIQLDSDLDNMKECEAFCEGHAASLPFGLKIHTLEGDMMASDKDYIIKGVNGEFYPIKEPIFRETYEEVFEKEGAE